MSYKELETQMKSIISKLQPGTTFLLKDIISDPPAGLGRTLYECVQSGVIPNVRCTGKTNGVETYEKQ